VPPSSDYAPPRTRTVRWINRLGRLAGAIGIPPIRLDADDLLERAARSTGLSDFGDDAFQQPFRLHIESLLNEAALTPMGRLIAQRDMLRTLENRLLLIDERKRYPEIADEQISRPLFIVGLPRTGTSILHELLAQDPANRTPMTWEVMWPIPRPDAASFDSDPRIAKTDASLKAVDQLIPGFKSMHPMGARLPQECVMLMNHDFMSMQLHTSNRVTGYQDWLQQQDLGETYRSHRRQLQLLQSRAPAENWVLKSPQHLWYLDALLSVYPDAQIVQTHRDPVKCAASISSLVCLLRGMASDHIDPVEVGRDWSARIEDGLNRSMNVRAEFANDRAQVFDLYFHEFMQDAVGSIRKMYNHFGRELSPEAEARIQRHLAANPQGKHGRHDYSLGGYGLNLDDERERFRRYREHFDVPDEVRVS
jgi:hypothetical protein